MLKYLSNIFTPVDQDIASHILESRSPRLTQCKSSSGLPPGAHGTDQRFYSSRCVKRDCWILFTCRKATCTRAPIPEFDFNQTTIVFVSSASGERRSDKKNATEHLLCVQRRSRQWHIPHYDRQDSTVNPMTQEVATFVRFCYLQRECVPRNLFESSPFVKQKKYFLDILRKYFQFLTTILNTLNIYLCENQITSKD